MKQNQVTVGMLLFVIVFYAAAFLSNAAVEKKPDAPSEIKQTETMKADDFKQKEKVFEKNILKKPGLVAVLSLSLFLAIFTGIFLDVRFLWGIAKGQRWIRDGLAHQEVSWGGAQVLQAAVILFFTEALLLITETVFFSVAGSKNAPRDFLLMANSLLRDSFVALFIVYLVTRRLGHRLSDIGLTMNNFFKNAVRGITGYIAMLPVLVLSLLAVALVAQCFAYDPPPQNVVQIYLKKSSDPYLLFFTLFVAGFGPLIEEIFFRGFAYKAFRQKLGVPRAMMVTSAIFAAFHMNLAAFAPIFILGMFLCYLYEETGSLVPSMTAHMLHNLLMVNFTLGFKSIAG